MHGHLPPLSPSLRYQIPIGDCNFILLTKDNLIELVTWEMYDFIEGANDLIQEDLVNNLVSLALQRCRQIRPRLLTPSVSSLLLVLLLLLLLLLLDLRCWRLYRFKKSTWLFLFVGFSRMGRSFFFHYGDVRASSGLVDCKLRLVACLFVFAVLLMSLSGTVLIVLLQGVLLI